MKTQHPALTPSRIKELAELGKRIDREEGDELKAIARAVFAAHEAKQKSTETKSSEAEKIPRPDVDQK